MELRTYKNLKAFAGGENCSESKVMSKNRVKTSQLVKMDATIKFLV